MKSSPRFLGLASALALTLFLGACGPGFPLSGSWTTQFDGTETITSETWNDGYSTTTVIEWDDVGQFVITQNAADAEYYPSRFSKIAYTIPGDDLAAYCYVAVDQPDAQAARTADDTSDASDLETGCGGYPWTQLTRAAE